MTVTAKSALLWKREPAGALETASFRLSGDIDERSQRPLENLATEMTSASVLDLSAIQRINSIGVRNWVRFLRTVAGLNVSLRRCPPVMIEQLNVVSGFKGNARIETILAPYECASCRAVRLEELSIGRDLRPGDPSFVPERHCPSCHGPMVFDDIPDRYLQFLRIV
jgi:hypothetical protein